MRLLVITLPLAAASPQAAYGWALSADGLSLADHGNAPAGQWPSGASECMAVVPAAALSWHRVDLPKGIGPRSPRLRMVLASLLEDRLLDEPEHLHLALAPAAEAGQQACWVAVCNKAWLQAHLQALEVAGAGVSRIGVATVPDGPLTAHVSGEPQQAEITLGGDGVAAGVVRLPLSAHALTLALGLAGSDADHALDITASPAVAAQAEQVLSRTVRLLTPADYSLQASRNRWDLAQLELAQTGRAQWVKRAQAAWRSLRHAPQWRPLRWGLLTLVAVQLLGLNTWAWHEKAALQARREAISRSLMDTFPTVKLVVDAPLQMEREVARLRQASGTASGRDLETLLGAVATVLPPGKAAQALEYTPGELRLRGLALGGDELTPLQTRLQASGLTARDESGTLVVRAATETRP